MFDYVHCRAIFRVLIVNSIETKIINTKCSCIIQYIRNKSYTNTKYSYIIQCIQQKLLIQNVHVSFNIYVAKVINTKCSCIIQYICSKSY